MHHEDAMARVIDVGHRYTPGSGRLIGAVGAFGTGKTAAELSSESTIEVISPCEATA